VSYRRSIDAVLKDCESKKNTTYEEVYSNVGATFRAAIFDTYGAFISPETCWMIADILQMGYDFSRFGNSVKQAKKHFVSLLASNRLIYAKLMVQLRATTWLIIVQCPLICWHARVMDFNLIALRTL
jgi:hypothetical protein